MERRGASNTHPSSPEAYILNMLRDEDAYKKAAHIESRTWGKLQLDERRNDIIKKEALATRELRIHGASFEIIDILQRHDLLDAKALILGCGEGYFERSLVAQGFTGSIHGIDISESSIAMARDLAAGLKLSYTCQDINALRLDENEYELIIVINAMHHILRLEHVAAEMHSALTPNGMLFLHDFIGESQFQWLDKRLEIVNDILGLLPDELKFNSLSEKITDRFDRMPVGSLASPFEAIRSGEIEPILLQHFDSIEEYRFDSILHFIAQKGVRSSFVQSQYEKNIFHILAYMDELLIKEKVLPPLGLQCLYRKKPKADQTAVPTATPPAHGPTPRHKGISMDLRHFQFTDQELDTLKSKFSYQPYIFSDSYRSGSGYQFMTGEKTRRMRRDDVPEGLWHNFSLANDRLAYMYDAMVAATLANAKTPISQCEVLDISCNEGYFLFRFLGHGAKRAIGYDILDLENELNLIASKMKRSISYNRVGYDQKIHATPGCAPADIVISTAFMCHLSDPTFHLAYLASLCRDTMLIYTAINDDSDYSIRYGSLTNLFFEAPFPYCFDSYTSMSLPLLQFGLARLGFTKVSEVKQDGNWIPIRQFRAFVATRG